MEINSVNLSVNNLDKIPKETATPIKLQKKIEKTEESIEKILPFDQVVKNVEKINKQLEINNVLMTYEKDEKSGKTIFQLRDAVTQEVIKQIPTKEMLNIAENIDQYLDSYNKSGNVKNNIGQGLVINKS